MAGSSESSHLVQQELEDVEGLDDILDDLQNWLAKAKFGEEKHGVRECAEKELPKASQRLLVAAGFQKKVYRCL